MKVLCRSHGLVPWQGHIECSRCLAVFQTRGRQKDNHATPLCACGAKLMPAAMSEDENFEARCICALCYEERVVR